MYYSPPLNEASQSDHGILPQALFVLSLFLLSISFSSPSGSSVNSTFTRGMGLVIVGVGQASLSPPFSDGQSCSTQCPMH